VTISGQEFLPSKGIGRPLIPELIELQQLLTALGISREQLIDLAILVGTDFNQGIHGVGPKTALKLIKNHGRLEELPDRFKSQLPDNIQELRTIFLNPTVTEDYEIKFKGIDETGLRKFLCEERGFSTDRVDLAIVRMHKFYARDRSTLQSWLGGDQGGA
jgi:flap endonuclease-1